MSDAAIDLQIWRKAAGFRARWRAEGEAPAPCFGLRLPLDAAVGEDLRWYLEHFHSFVGAGTRVRAQAVEEKIAALGEALFAALGGPKTGAANPLLAALGQRRPATLTIASAESEVMQQPWELLSNAAGPLAFQGIRLRRQLSGTPPAALRPFALPLRLLLIVARPKGTGGIDPRNSLAPLLDGLEQLPAGSVEIEVCRPPTLARLEAVVTAAVEQQRPFHIVHFDGHGTFQPRTGKGLLFFERADRWFDPVSGQRLGRLLARLGVPLVILEACRTSDLSDQPTIGSLAPALLDAGVGSVIAFSHSIHVEASRILVESFYCALAAGSSIGDSLAAARLAMRHAPQRWLHLGPNPATVAIEDWFVPQLYQVGDDPVVVGSPQAPASPASLGKRSLEDGLHGFPPAPHYQFHGRSAELLELERAFESSPALVISGGGGMGKTALAREAGSWWLRLGLFELAIFVSFEYAASVDRVVQEIGRACEGITFASRSREEQRASAVAFFQERQMLLVWDNFESTLPQFQRGKGGLLAFPPEERENLAELYLELTARAPKGRLLLTCRPADTLLPGIGQLHLECLARPDSLHWIHAIASSHGIDLEREGCRREDVEQLLGLVADHPLSISLVAPHLGELLPAEICRDFGNLLGCFTEPSATEPRNRSLEASFEFSSTRLSPAALAVLPCLAFFQGGAFEVDIRSLARLSETEWAAIRVQLTATALVWLEPHPAEPEQLFVRIHPALALVVPRSPDRKLRRRFLSVAYEIQRRTGPLLSGRRPAAGMELLALQEPALLSALECSCGLGRISQSWEIVETLSMYYQMAGHLLEHRTVIEWMGERFTGEGRLNLARWSTKCNQAVSLARNGASNQAAATLRYLLKQIQRRGIRGVSDPTRQVASTYGYLGQVFTLADRPREALEAALVSLRMFESLADSKSFSWALNTAAKAYKELGQLDEALGLAERALALDRDLGSERDIAATEVLLGEILTALQQWAAADDHFESAFTMARNTGELEILGVVLQLRGSLHQHCGYLASSSENFEEAILMFREIGDLHQEMRTCDLLGTTERLLGRLESAEAWYQRAAEMASDLGDQAQLSVVAFNLGLIHQARAELAPDEAGRQRLLKEAIASIHKCLEIEIELGDQIGAADSYHQLGVVQRLAGDLDAAETSALLALHSYESFALPEVWKDYDSLARIAAARGDSVAVVEWQAKRDAKLATLGLRFNEAKGAAIGTA